MEIQFRYKKQRILEASERYRSQYGLDENHPKVQRLKGASEQEINEILNTSWTSNICNRCREDVNITAQISNPHGYDGAIEFVCKSCLSTTLEALAKEEENE